MKHEGDREMIWELKRFTLAAVSYKRKTKNIKLKKHFKKWAETKKVVKAFFNIFSYLKLFMLEKYFACNSNRESSKNTGNCSVI